MPNIFTAQLQKGLGGTKDISQLPSDVSNYFKGKTKSQIASDVINMVATNPGLASDQMVLGAAQLYNKNYKEGFDNVLAGAMQFNPSLGMVAYHGSPHKFDKFDMSKIGTGEGAQVYGHGLYFAENKAVAKSYTKPNISFWGSGDDYSPSLVVDGETLGSGSLGLHLAGSRTIEKFRKMPADEARNYAIKKLQKTQKSLRNDIEKSRNPERDSGIIRRLNEVTSSIEKLKSAKDIKHIPGSDPGNIYHVDIPDEHIDKMLDWDKPLNEQPEAVQKAVKSLGVIKNKSGQNLLGMYDSPTGESIIEAMGKGESSTKKLKEAGIVGIKYLDAGSRGAGKGSRNFVLFDDEIPKVIKRE